MVNSHFICLQSKCHKTCLKYAAPLKIETHWCAFYLIREKAEWDILKLIYVLSAYHPYIYYLSFLSCVYFYLLFVYIIVFDYYSKICFNIGKECCILAISRQFWCGLYSYFANAWMQLMLVWLHLLLSKFLSILSSIKCIKIKMITE